MEMQRFLQSLQADLAAIAAGGDDATSVAAERLTQAIRASAGLRLLEALSEAALELSGQLPSGHVEVRLAGQDPTLTYVEEAGEPPPAGEEASTARITLRLYEALKASVEAAAAREGVSVNTWLVRALQRAVSGTRTQRSGKRLRGFAQS